MPRPFPHRSALAAVAVAAALVPAASAAADSIVYVDGGNVFSANKHGLKVAGVTTPRVPRRAVSELVHAIAFLHTKNNQIRSRILGALN